MGRMASTTERKDREKGDTKKDKGGQKIRKNNE
jgi:hypothetical protein